MTLVPSLQAGSQFGKYCFSYDSKYLFSCCDLVIKVFNIANGECLRDLRGHTKPATGIAVNPSNNLQILSCGQDGQLIHWDYLDGVQLKQHNLHMSLHGILSVSAENKSIIMLAQTTAQKSTYSLMLWKMKKLEVGEFSKPKILIENCDGDHRLVSIGCQKEFIASGLKHQMSIYSMKKGSTKVVWDHEKFNKFKAITCLACHPTEYCIATGLENGKIILWHSFFKDGQQTSTTFHWHALAVLCLDFSPNGSSLLSGGHECVLVRWQMGNQNMRDYKPRMGAPVTQVLCSPDGTLYASKHADNVIQLLDINLKVLQVFRGMTHATFGHSGKKNPIPVGLKYDPRSRTLVTNGLPGHLQFYSTSLCRQLFNLDIVGQNYISPESVDRPMVITEVTSTAISDDGSWLATFEMWDDSFFSPEFRLKFWCYSSQAQTYSLNTTVENPHDDKVTSMLFRPEPAGQAASSSLPTLVTIGADLCFKLWTLIDDSNIYRNNTRWSCDSVGFYRRLNAGCADFSRDASTLAVAFEHLLTVWDPDSNMVRTTLSNSLPTKETIIHIKFGSHQCCCSLVVATTHTLLAWDLFTLTIKWTISTQVTSLIRDPSSNLMAAVSMNRKVSIFRPSSPDMIYEHDMVSASDILDVVFVPDGRHEKIAGLGWPGSSQIYIYNTEQQLLTFDLSCDGDNSSKVQIAQNLPQSTYSTFMAEKIVRDQSDTEMKTTMGKTNVADDSLISLMHSNEPVSMLCEKYLSNLLAKRSTTAHSISGTSAIGGVHRENNISSDDEVEADEVEADEMEADEVKQETEGTTKIAEVNTSTEKDMNKLLSKPLDWVKWCASLHLK